MELLCLAASVPGEWRVYGVQLLSAAPPNSFGLLDSGQPSSTEVRLAANWSKTAVLALPALLWTLVSCAQQAPKATTPAAVTQSEQSSSPQRPAREELATPLSPSSSGVESEPPENFDGFADEPGLKDVFFEPD